MQQTATPETYRAIFISDLHIGSNRFQANALLQFLSTHQADVIYLVGDVFDFWSLRAGAHWASEHTAVLRALWFSILAGKRIILIPGNHDEQLLHFRELPVHGFEIHREYVHETANGERLLIVHGHHLDKSMNWSARWVHHACALRERAERVIRRRPWHTRGRHRRPGSQAWRNWRRSAGGIDDLEIALAGEAARRSLDGVLCGHTHMPADRLINGMRYLNCGDWVTNCTAITEDASGSLALKRSFAPTNANFSIRQSIAAAGNIAKLPAPVSRWLR